MKVFVTGPDGILGSNLVRELLKREHDVSVLLEEGKEAPTLSGLNIKRNTGNILDRDNMIEIIAGHDAVIHCAAVTSLFPPRSDAAKTVNIEGTENIVEAVLANNITRLVYVGTANSFGFGCENEPGVEGNPYLSSHYGLDYMDSKKIAQENVLKAVKERNLPAIVVNPTFMIGPYDSRPSSGAMILAVYKGKVPGYTSGGRNYIAVKDVAFAIANALEMGRLGECYILGNENLSYREAFSLIAETIGAKVPVRALSDRIVKTYGNICSACAKVLRNAPTVTRELALLACEKNYYSAEKARNELQLPETPIREAIKECFEWFRENGYLDK